MNKLHMRIQILLILFMPLFYIGIGGKYPWILLGKSGIAIGMSFFFSTALLFTIVAIVIKVEQITSYRIYFVAKLNLCLATLFIGLYDIIQFKHFAQFGYQKPQLLYLLDVLFCICTVLYLYCFSGHKPNTKFFFSLVSLFIILHGGLSIYYFPLSILRSDMLSAIELSVNAFMHSGNPYMKTLPMVGIPPYLPMTILSFLPAVVLHIDPRVLSIIFTIIMLLLLLYQYYNLTRLSQIALILVLCNPYWLMRHDLYFQFFLIELVIIFIYFKSINEIWRSSILGLFIATLQFAWVLFPFILLAYSVNYRQLLRQLVVSVLIASVIIFGFVHGHFDSFTKAVFLHHEYLQPYSSDITFGLSPIFYFAHNQKLLYGIQIIGCFWILVYSLIKFFIHKERKTQCYLTSATICYFYFMITNYFIETYLLIPVVFVLVLQLQGDNE